MIAASGVSFARGRRAVLTDISLSLEAGCLTVVVGPNGAGKSTLMKILSGEWRPDRGSVTLHGRPLGAIAPAALARRRAVMPQTTALAFALTVHEVVRIGALAGGARDPDRLAADLLVAEDLASWGGRLVTTLSGGERQRVAFVRALAQVPRPAGPDGPATLLLDEPTASLDLARQIALLERARAFARAGGAVFAVLHDLNLAAEFADEILVLDGGRITAAGAPSPALYASVVAEVYGLPGASSRLPSDGTAFVLPQARAALGPGRGPRADEFRI